MRVAAIVAWTQINLFLALIAAVVLGAAGVFLTTAWVYGPNVLIERAQYRRFTAAAEGRIVESWIALELDQASVRNSRFWRASARATPCVVVEPFPAAESSASWNVPERRAFCGRRLTFETGYTLADVHELSTGVPFAWTTDAHGYAVPEIRMNAATRAWLASKPAHKFMHADWPATTELDWLMLELDRPIDDAIAGWSAPPATMTLMNDPAHPGRPVPAALIKARLSSWVNWPAVIVLGGLGAFLWVLGFSLVPQLSGLPRLWRGFIMILPLLTLPTWVDTFPAFIAPLSAGWTAVVSDMLGQVNPLDRFQATEPDAALLAGGTRLRWLAAQGAYADTFGRVAPDRGAGTFRDADAALLALSDAVAARVRSLPSEQRVALFTALRRDKRRDLKAAGLVFLGAAQDCLAHPSVAPDAREARRFLEEWFVSPVEPVDRTDLGYAARRQLVAALSRLSEPDIARSASEFVANLH